MFHLIIINRNQNMMACTKQTPRNPHVSRPTTAIGKDVQPKQRTNLKQMSKKNTYERGETAQKISVAEIIEMRHPQYWRN